MYYPSAEREFKRRFPDYTKHTIQSLLEAPIPSIYPPDPLELSLGGSNPLLEEEDGLNDISIEHRTPECL